MVVWKGLPLGLQKIGAEGGLSLADSGLHGTHGPVVDRRCHARHEPATCDVREYVPRGAVEGSESTERSKLLDLDLL